MPQYIYRYRSPDALLHGFHEFEKQEIFLAPPKKLNDPMEGYRDVTWQGDRVVWKNLLKHYVLCLLWLTTYCYIARDDGFSVPPLPIRLNADDLPTDLYRQIYQQVLTAFFQKRSVEELLDHLSVDCADVRRDVLQSRLSMIHPIAWDAVQESLAQHNLANAPPKRLQSLDRALQRRLKALRRTLEDSPGRELEDLFFHIANNTNDQMALIHAYNHHARTGRSPEKVAAVLFNFPQRYIEELITALLDPPWYTACFSANCSNASMWSMYAQHHQGFALKFLPDVSSDGRLSLPVDEMTDDPDALELSRNPRKQRIAATLHPVSYGKRPPSTNFFKHVGFLLPPRESHNWYRDESAGFSALWPQASGSLDEWRDEFWKQFNSSATLKLKDWAHEQEYRLVAPDPLGRREAHHTYTYEFASLGGIVFGLRTSLADKLEVIRLVERKCRETGRNDFEFSQMQYSAEAGELEVQTLPLLKFNA